MNLTMKEECIKRQKEDITIWTEQNQRLTKTMEAESRNTTKVMSPTWSQIELCDFFEKILILRKSKNFQEKSGQG